MSKIVGAAEAVGLIKSGDRLFIGGYCAEPQTLVEALMEQADRLEGVVIYTMMPMGPCPYAAAGMERHFRLFTFLVSPCLLEAVQQGRADYIPCRLADLPRLWEQGHFPIDFALIQVAPGLGEGGAFSLGISVDFTQAALRRARCVIAEVNRQMPYALGEALLPLEHVDYVVESSRPLLPLPAGEAGPVDRTIARLVTDLVPHGATLQVGVGTLPEVILRGLTEKQDLGVHSGLLTDGLMELMECGAVTNHCKGIDPGKTVATTVMGSERLYRFVDRNPGVQLREAGYTHAAEILGRIRRFVAINSALEVDLGGQINAEVVGPRLLSGAGGQADFVRGAFLSAGGRAITALPATARGGEISRIVPVLERGTAVTTLRAEADVVVTEYGVACLRGRSLRQRAQALCAVAHPRFRSDLEKAAAQMEGR